MRSAIEDVMPASLRRGLLKLGHDLSIARRKRGLTVAMMAERLGVSRGTYARAEKGDPNTSMGVFAMALFVLGFGDRLHELIDAGRDDQGLVLDVDRLPKRVRPRKVARPL
jgi:DNA-binding XRE family transcriptional regulator